MARLARIAGTLGISLLSAMPLMSISSADANCIEGKLAAASSLEVKAPNSSRTLNHLATFPGKTNLATTILSSGSQGERQMEATLVGEGYSFDREDLNAVYPQAEARPNKELLQLVSPGTEGLMEVLDSQGNILYNNLDNTLAGTVVGDEMLAQECTSDLSVGQEHMGKVFPKLVRVRQGNNTLGAYVAPTVNDGVYNWSTSDGSTSGTIEASINSSGDVEAGTWSASGPAELCFKSPKTGLEDCVKNSSMLIDYPGELEGTSYANVSGQAANCVEDEYTACMQNGRFRVQVNFETAKETGKGKVAVINGARHQTNESTSFTLFNPNRGEIYPNVLNACALNGTYWVFAGGTTDQKIELVVTDTQSGATKTYNNPLGTKYLTVTDSNAFECE